MNSMEFKVHLVLLLLLIIIRSILPRIIRALHM
jgi:hypothetical protein